ncbi:DUF2799 domain-containing protein [Photobacterium lutimaris]|uniref:DUF2799 domain-containing protein n=1 Tax=Photobacterium lutimaris TaxID=388278 RepID=A0A2T3IYW8_9GAMM|nr:DUF2799 domain-containing protein [Photobacterium lutimaris]PSU33852.1 hypothetical protein C9I99_10795 [Photobacterium lutimaris]TDR76177.1 uncharacterized protein DUF2799 [Photobacterium lutimaris]
MFRVSNIILLTGVFLLSACSTGLETGNDTAYLQGYNLAFEGQHMKLPANLSDSRVQEFEQGYSDGLNLFCVNGYDAAWAGAEFTNVCDNLNPYFISQYEQGLHDLQLEDWNNGYSNLLHTMHGYEYDYAIE